MPTTIGRRSLPAPVLGDNPDVPRDISNLATALQDAAVFERGTLAARPTTGQILGDIYMAYDDTTMSPNGSLYWWDTVAWRLGSPPVDPAANVAGARTLGSGAQQAAPGNDARFGGIVPIGASIDWSGTGDPSGGNFLLEDGRAISRGTYAACFTALGTAFGSGDGSTTFNIPDSRGRTTVYQDNMGTAQGAANRIPNSNRSRGQSGGEELHLLSSAESGLRDHGHAIRRWSVVNSFPGSGIACTIAMVTGGQGADLGFADDSSLLQHSGSASATNGHNNMQPYQVKNKVIRVL